MRGKVSAVSTEGVVRMYTIRYDKGGKTEAEVPGTRLRSLGMIPMSVFTDHCKHRLKVSATCSLGARARCVHAVRIFRVFASPRP